MMMILAIVVVTISISRANGRAIKFVVHLCVSLGCISSESAELIWLNFCIWT